MENNTSTPHSLDAYLKSLFENQLRSFRDLLKEEIELANKKEWQERLLSPGETCKLFQPKISLPTLKRWTDQGLVKRYDLGGRVLYKYGEVMDSLKTLKRIPVT